MFGIKDFNGMCILVGKEELGTNGSEYLKSVG